MLTALRTTLLLPHCILNAEDDKLDSEGNEAEDILGVYTVLTYITSNSDGETAIIVKNKTKL